MRFLCALLLAALPLVALAQVPAGTVGIGTLTPNSRAALDITAADKGLLIPRLDSAQRAAIASPPDGLLVFQKDGRSGFWYAFGGQWLWLPDKRRSGDNLGNHTATKPLNLQANALVGSGADLGAAVGVGVRADGGLNLGQNTSGNNVFVGYQAGQAAAGASASLFVGYQAGQANTSSDYNQFIGFQAGQANTTGFNNQFSGFRAGASNTTGIRNQFDGWGSGQANTTGFSNYFAGYRSGYGNTTGNNNLFLGYLSGFATTTGGGNQFVGYASGQSNTTGDSNQFTGYLSGQANTTGSDNQFSGYQSGYSNTSGRQNYFSGYQSGQANTTGEGNLFVGYQSGQNNSTIGANQFIGYQSGFSNSTGRNNQFSGLLSGPSNTTGSQNQFSGYESGYYNRTGEQNHFVGYQSGFNNSTGSNNQFVGYQSGFYNTTGSNNLFVGFGSGGSNATGSNNLALGYQAGPAAGSPNLTNAGAIGYNAQVSQSNSLVLGGIGPDAVNVGIGTSAPQQALQVGSPTYGQPALLRLATGNAAGGGNAARQWELGVQMSAAAPNDVTGENYDFTLSDASANQTRLLVEWDTGNVGIGTSAPNAGLQLASSLSVPLRTVRQVAGSYQDVTVTDADYTVRSGTVVGGSTPLFSFHLPDPSGRAGRVVVLLNSGNTPATLYTGLSSTTQVYDDGTGLNLTQVPAHAHLVLHCEGTTWLVLSR